jgi:hypothetical protein
VTRDASSNVSGNQERDSGVVSIAFVVVPRGVASGLGEARELVFGVAVPAHGGDRVLPAALRLRERLLGCGVTVRDHDFEVTIWVLIT